LRAHAEVPQVELGVQQAAPLAGGVGEQGVHVEVEQAQAQAAEGAGVVFARQQAGKVEHRAVAVGEQGSASDVEQGAQGGSQRQPRGGVAACGYLASARASGCTSRWQVDQT
jgi:hypothetical protein